MTAPILKYQTFKKSNTKTNMHRRTDVVFCADEASCRAVRPLAFLVEAVRTCAGKTTVRDRVKANRRCAMPATKGGIV
jgi:hypothetical protein